MLCPTRFLVSLVAVASVVTVLPNLGVSQDVAVDAEKPAAEASLAELATAVKSLDSDDFKTRREATKTLIDAGHAAVEPVAKAANTDQLELASRCIEILKQIYQSKNAETKQAAKTALEKLSQSEHRSVAQRAAEAIKKPQPAKVANNVFGNARIQIRLVPGGGIQVAGGQFKREVQVEENGKKIRISESGADGISVSVTETVNGKQITKKYKAKNATELKKKHPEAYKLYTKHMGQAPVQARVIVGRVGRIQIPGFPGRRNPAVPNAKAIEEARTQLKEAQKQIKQAVERLRQLASRDSVKPEELSKAVEEFEAIRKRLQQAETKLKK